MSVSKITSNTRNEDYLKVPPKRSKFHLPDSSDTSKRIDLPPLPARTNTSSYNPQRLGSAINRGAKTCLQNSAVVLPSVRGRQICPPEKKSSPVPSLQITISSASPQSSSDSSLEPSPQNYRNGERFLTNPEYDHNDGFVMPGSVNFPKDPAVQPILSQGEGAVSQNSSSPASRALAHKIFYSRPGQV